jgi:hypothetical protein
LVSQTEKELLYKNSIYFLLLEHRQEYRNELTSIVVRNILIFYIQMLSQVVKPLSDTLLRYQIIPFT